MTREKLNTLFRGLPVPLFVGVTFLFALGFLLVRVPEPARPTAIGNPAGSVSVVRLDSSNADLVLRQEAVLRDPAPLFLPTVWNTAYAVQADRMILRPDASFKDYPFKPVFSGVQGPVDIPAPVHVPESAARAFDPLQSDKPFIGMAPRSAAPEPASARDACIELRSAASGSMVARLVINDLDAPKGALWAPAEFTACVGDAGLVGRPSLVLGSGLDSMDRLLEKALVHHWPELEKLGRLQPGVYRVILGP